jgi:hypothetical protein
MMHVTATAVTDRDVERAAIDRLRVAAARVYRHSERNWDNFEERITWFCLSVRWTAGDSLELVGRRKTRAELLAMVETMDPALTWAKKVSVDKLRPGGAN